MQWYEYQRPREKLRLHGVDTLSLTELLQLIIASGGVGQSAARIARQIEGLVQSGHVSYDTLCSIKGMGDAKACQVLAALELAYRLQKGSP